MTKKIVSRVLLSVALASISFVSSQAFSAADDYKKPYRNPAIKKLSAKKLKAKLAINGSASAQVGQYVYVANQGSSDVSVIDNLSGKNVATIKVGSSPIAITASPIGGTLYVANHSGSSVSVIDAATNTVTAKIPVAKLPSAIVVSPDGGRLYVASQNPAVVSVVDLSSNKVTKTFSVAKRPSALAVTANGTQLFVASSQENSVTRINTDGYKVAATIAVGNVPTAISVANNNVYVANQLDNTVSVINSNSNSVASTINVGNSPVSIVANPSGTRVYVANNFDGTVSVIDTSSNAVVATDSVGDSPQGLAINGAGTNVIAANNGDNTISVINSATNTAGSAISVSGNAPAAAAMFSGAITYAYISDYQNSVLNIVNTSNNSLVKTIAFPDGLIDVASNPAGTRIYAATGANVTVIDTSVNEIKSTISVGNTATSIKVDATGENAYVATTYKNTNNIVFIDLKSNKVTTTIPTKLDWTHAVAINPAGTSVYALGCNALAKIDVATQKIVSTQTVTTNSSTCASDIALTPSGTQLYIAIRDNKVKVLDASTLVIQTTIAVPATMGFMPSNIAINASGTTGYLTVSQPYSHQKSQVLTLDLTNNTIASQIDAGLWPQGLGITPAGNRLYVLDTISDTFLDTVSGKKPRKNSYNVVVIDTATNQPLTRFALNGAPLYIAFATVMPSK